MKTLIARFTKKDFRVDTFSTGGPGGQNQNKSQTGVRITHIATGLSAESRTYKSQGQNKKSTFRKLGALIKQHYQTLENVKRVREISEGIIRTYNEPDNRVKDHQSGTQFRYSDILDNIEPAIDSRRAAK